MSRSSNKARFNVAECINDIVDHIDFSTHSYHSVSQVDLYRIDLRDIPGLPKEEFLKVLRDIEDLLEISRLPILNSKRSKDRRARFWCATLHGMISMYIELPLREQTHSYTEVTDLMVCEDLKFLKGSYYEQKLKNCGLSMAYRALVDHPGEILCECWKRFLGVMDLLHCYRYCIAPKSVISEAKKVLELADMLVDKYGESMRCRRTVVEILPKAIVQKGVQIVKARVKASLEGTQITLDSILEKRRGSYEEKLEHRCRMELYERAVHEEYGDGGVALLRELSRIRDLRDLKRPSVAESSLLDGWKRFSDDLLFGRVLLYDRGKLIRVGENFMRVVP